MIGYIYDVEPVTFISLLVSVGLFLLFHLSRRLTMITYTLGYETIYFQEYLMWNCSDL